MDYKNVRFRIILRKILFIGITWPIIGLFLGLFEHMVLLANVGEELTRASEYNLGLSLRTYVFGALIGGLVVGFTEYTFLRDRTRNYSFLKLIFFKFTFYLLIIIALTVVASLLYNSINQNLPVYHYSVIEQTKVFLTNFGLIKNVIVWSLVITFVLSFNLVNDKFGPGTLLKFATGSYHKPKQEYRIFMFLDLKSSTTIAENLGSINYFNLLNDFFSDATDPVVLRQGEIYQYVGDEMVVSWPLKKGITNANCIQCFFDIQDRINRFSSRYLDRYGMVPSFKAGFHYGEVTTGEIGVIKKEIVFSGDVMNTTSRIQEECNHYSVRILLSRRLYELLPKLNFFRFSELGEILLRGKEKKIILYTVEKIEKEKQAEFLAPREISQ